VSPLRVLIPTAQRSSEPRDRRVFLTFVVGLSVAACSGPGRFVAGGNQGIVPGLIVTLRATPLSPPSSTNLLSFRATVVGVSLTPSTGGSVSVPLNSDLYRVDLTRLQSDTAFLAFSNAIPAGTYTSMVLSFSDPSVTFCTQTQGITGCAEGSVSTLSGGAAIQVITAAPFPLVITPGQGIGLAVNMSVANALTIDEQTQAISAVDVGAANVLTVGMIPPSSSSLPSSALDFVDDLTGVVSSVDATRQSVTIETATKGSITAIAGASTTVSPNCTTFHLGNTFTCAQQGQVASLETVLNGDGTFALLQYDPLGITAGDWIEGVIGLPPSSSTQFQLVTNDLVLAPANSLIGNNLELGAPVTVTLANPKPFVVDTKNLVVPNSTFSGATDASVLTPGQTLAVHVVSFTGASGAVPAAASVDFVYLRFTRITGSVAGFAPPNLFAMQSFPSFVGLTVPTTVQLSSGSNFDGITGASGLVSGQIASIRALYFGSPTGPTPTPTPFSAAKVRIH
jgi:Domain of unknown function (DUF4382)